MLHRKRHCRAEVRVWSFLLIPGSYQTSYSKNPYKQEPQDRLRDRLISINLLSTRTKTPGKEEKRSEKKRGKYYSITNAAAVAKTVQEAKESRKKFEEANRHNKTMEAIALEYIIIMSQIFTTSGRNSILSVDFFNPIELDSRYEYALALTGFHTYNSIPNIEEGKNNKLYYWDLNNSEKEVPIPTGSYEITDIESYLRKQIIPVSVPIIEYDDYFSLKPNNNTLRCEIKSKYKINFKPEDSLASLLGFSHTELESNIWHHSDLPVQIVKVATVHKLDDSIIREEIRTYHPFVKSFANNDEIEIVIYQQDALLLMSEAALVIEGTLGKTNGSTGDIQFTTNCGAYLFDSITYELNGKEVDKVRDPDTVSTIRGYLCYNKNDDTQRCRMELPRKSIGHL
ncbi:hypothetical protein NQ317_019844 [Molorchus minor]|uniref:Uncharacterized protein n=1 Tax=Molorchus minor TaxID=1323400 RepID=A0ABQ9J994_9CUCU|nr:hypothetical protein NQ317_019844 [Molorchus minor]